MRRSLGRHGGVLWLAALRHASRFFRPRQQRRHGQGAAAARSRGGRTIRRRWLAGAAAVVGLTLVAAGLFSLNISPLSLARAEDLSVTVLDRNQRLLRAYTASDGRWRLPVAPSEVDQRYLAMLIGFEDKRFRSHRGVDAWAIGRACWQLLRHGRIVSGGSTLSMQVARLLLGEHQRTAAGKLRQAFGALELERRLSKAEIIGLYLRLAPF